MRIALITTSALLLCASNAFALQPLSTFVENARSANNSNRRADAQRRELEAEADAALGGSLPSIDVRGILARSQLNPTFPSGAGMSTGMAMAASSPLIPQNIWAATAGITVPISVSSWEHAAASRATAHAAIATEQATELDVERQVTQDYFNTVGSEAMVKAAERGLELSTSNARSVRAMAGEGEASQMDAERARADVARAEQDLADAQRNLLQARRQLLSRTGLEPEPGSMPTILTDDLQDEAPLEAWMNRSLDKRPAVVQAIDARKAANKSLDAARTDWLPTVSASANEIYTNATENLGRKDFYSLLGLATWHLDLAKGPTVRAQNAALDAARATEAQAKIDSQDAVYLAWVQVKTDVTKTRSARAGEDAAAKTANLARERYAAGEATQLDVLQAQQTYVQAEVARIRVESDLAYARAALRLSVAEQRR
jgi:outer membrane protein TolC